MKCLVRIALVGMLAQVGLYAANFADSIVAYNPGTGFATEFGSGLGFTNAAAALGEPSRSTPGDFGGPVDPFNPPYLRDQLVSIGAGGSLTVGLSTPISNSADHPFGLDFMIYGNAGFVITNGDFSGGGITDGSLFGSNPGTTRVSISADNVTFYPLDSAKASVVDTLYPTDGNGSFDLPVNPELTNGSFAGLGLSGIRELYSGSAGGAGFDLSWARASDGSVIDLASVRFVRIDVLTGVAEVDGLAAIATVPEPGSRLLLGAGLALLVAGIRVRFPRAAKTR